MRTPVLSRALLGLIAAEPMSGYGLARLFERTLARAWPARHPQIYPALAELEEQGLLRVSDTGPRRRKTYAITKNGIAEVQRWLRDTGPDRTVRNESILRLFMLWLLESPEAIAFLDEEIESHRQRLAGFEQTLAEDEASAASTGSLRAASRSARRSRSSGASDTSAKTSNGRPRRENESQPAQRDGTTRASDG